MLMGWVVHEVVKMGFGGVLPPILGFSLARCRAAARRLLATSGDCA
jgi:hypothetical protein